MGDAGARVGAGEAAAGGQVVGEDDQVLSDGHASRVGDEAFDSGCREGVAEPLGGDVGPVWSPKRRYYRSE